MSDDTPPITIRDNDQFESLLQIWNYNSFWDTFDIVYDGKPAIPSRLHAFTIIASNDPAEPYGALLQIIPKQSENDGNPNYIGQKLLAKVRLS